MSQPASLLWFAHHECRLAWRDWQYMMTAGRGRRFRSVAIGILLFAIFLHAVAYFMVGAYGDVGPDPGKTVLLVITGNLLL